MKVILFGATGMVGQGVLRECLLDPDVTDVLARRAEAPPVSSIRSCVNSFAGISWIIRRSNLICPGTTPASSVSA